MLSQAVAATLLVDIMHTTPPHKNAPKKPVQPANPMAVSTLASKSASPLPIRKRKRQDSTPDETYSYAPTDDATTDYESGAYETYDVAGGITADVRVNEWKWPGFTQLLPLLSIDPRAFGNETNHKAVTKYCIQNGSVQSCRDAMVPIREASGKNTRVWMFGQSAYPASALLHPPPAEYEVLP